MSNDLKKELRIAGLVLSNLPRAFINNVEVLVIDDYEAKKIAETIKKAERIIDSNPALSEDRV